MAASSSAGPDPWEVRDAWEDVDATYDDDEYDYANVDATYAGQQLADYLLFLKHSHEISAVACCLLSFWSSKAGACGMVNDLALPPGKEAHRYNRHLDKVIGAMKKSSYYKLEKMPLSLRATATRVLDPVWAQPIQDAFEKMVAAYEDVKQSLDDGIAAGYVPPSYFSHTVVQTANDDEVVLPLYLYVDGLPITRRDGCVGFVLRSILPPRRPYLIICLRKEDMCKCGCKGWCTLHVVHVFLKWGFRAISNGRHPISRHDKSPFTADDPRAARANQPFLSNGRVVKGACILLKGDVKEWSSTYGLPDSRSHFPCPECCIEGEDFLNLTGFTALSLRDEVETFQTYSDACSKCEIETSLLAWEDFRAVRQSLHQDKRDDGARGLALDDNFPTLGLLKGDRLEPTEDILDVYCVYNFDESSYLPRKLHFWRRKNETYARHRCPLFDEQLGISNLSLALDGLDIGPSILYSSLLP